MTDWTSQSRERDRIHAPVIATRCFLAVSRFPPCPLSLSLLSMFLAFTRSPSSFLPFSPCRFCRCYATSRTSRPSLRDARNCFSKRRRRGSLIRGFARIDYREMSYITISLNILVSLDISYRILLAHANHSHVQTADVQHIYIYINLIIIKNIKRTQLQFGKVITILSTIFLSF